MLKKPAAILILVLMLGAVVAAPALAEGVPGLDPRQYTAGQFLRDVESKDNSEMVGLAILWGYGYMCGKDESFIQPMNDSLIEGLTFKYLVVCKERPQLNLIQATQEVMRLSEALKRPAGN
ncbi:MAG: DUF4179 domain-containing protein [Desulfarculus sp.]|nr:DUF4179 domain-containing protein [Desulfarculus sp.]